MAVIPHNLDWYVCHAGEGDETWICENYNLRDPPTGCEARFQFKMDPFSGMYSVLSVQPQHKALCAALSQANEELRRLRGVPRLPEPTPASEDKAVQAPDMAMQRIEDSVSRLVI